MHFLFKFYHEDEFCKVWGETYIVYISDFNLNKQDEEVD